MLILFSNNVVFFHLKSTFKTSKLANSYFIFISASFQCRSFQVSNLSAYFVIFFSTKKLLQYLASTRYQLTAAQVVNTRRPPPMDPSMLLLTYITHLYLLINSLPLLLQTRVTLLRVLLLWALSPTTPTVQQSWLPTLWVPSPTTQVSNLLPTISKKHAVKKKMQSISKYKSELFDVSRALNDFKRKRKKMKK